MTVPFTQTMRHLSADRGRGTSVAIVISLIGFAAWMAWFTLGEVDVQVVGTEARIVVEDKTHAVQSPLPGRHVSRKVELGIEVVEGDVLAELDTSVQQRQLFEARTRVKGIEPQLEVLEREIAAFEGATDAEKAEANVRLAQGAARRDEGELRAKIAEELAERKERLAKAGIISELDQLQNDATAAQERKAMQVMELELSRLQAESSAASRDKRELEALRRARVELDGIRETVQASISVLEAEIARQGAAPLVFVGVVAVLVGCRLAS